MNADHSNEYDHLDAGESRQYQDTMESTDAVAPPIQSASVDLGMISVSSSQRLASTGDRFYNPNMKKKVVLRQPKVSSVFKSQHHLPAGATG